MLIHVILGAVKLSVIKQIVKYHYSDCHYAECCYTKCRGAICIKPQIKRFLDHRLEERE
jgi:hypothetical protein